MNYKLLVKLELYFSENCFTASFTIILSLNTPLLQRSLLISLTHYSQQRQQALPLQCFFLYL